MIGASRPRSSGRGPLRRNALSLFFALILLLALVGQSVSGMLEVNAEAAADQLPQVSWFV